jgi:hypothetical protein
MNPRTREFVFTRVLPLVVIVGGLYELYEHHMLPGVNQVNAAASSAGPDVSFVVGSAHDCKNGGLLLNEGKFPNQTKTAYIEPTARNGLNAGNAVGKTVTLHGVGLSTYHNAARNIDSQEYKVTSSAQLSVQ